VPDPGRQPGEEQNQPSTPDHLKTLALVLLGVTAFAALLNEIAWTRVLIMIVGGSTYAFTLILFGSCSAIAWAASLVARRSAPRAETAATAGLAAGLTGVGAAALFVFFGFLPSYIIAVFQIPDLSAISRLWLSGSGGGRRRSGSRDGMGMTFPLLTDLTARSRTARGADVGTAYALNTVGQHSRAAITGLSFVVALGTQATLRVGLVRKWTRGVGARVARRARSRGGFGRRPPAAGTRLVSRRPGTLALVAAVAAPGWSTRLIDLGPTITTRTSRRPGNLRGQGRA